MSTTLREMARRSNGGMLDHMSSCIGPADMAMMVGGSGLVLYGLIRRTLPALGLAAMGAAVVAYACCRDHDDAADKLRKQVINAPKRYGRESSGDIADYPQTPRDMVDEASMESFPGSDPPAYTHATAG